VALLPWRRLRLTAVGLREPRHVVVPLEALLPPRGCVARAQQREQATTAAEAAEEAGEAGESEV